jgi:hypothetical protein
MVFPPPVAQATGRRLRSPSNGQRQADPYDFPAVFPSPRCASTGGGLRSPPGGWCFQPLPHSGRRLRSPSDGAYPCFFPAVFPSPRCAAPGGGYAAHRADGVSSHSRIAGGGYAAHLSPGSVPTPRCAGTGVRLRSLPGGRCSQHSTRKRRVEVTQPDRVQRQAYTDFLNFLQLCRRHFKAIEPRLAFFRPGL